MRIPWTKNWWPICKALQAHKIIDPAEQPPKNRREMGRPCTAGESIPNHISKFGLTLAISRTLNAEIYEVQSATPRGVCLALPRYADAATPIQLLGIICQGIDTSNACFWDNQQDKMTLPIDRTGQFALNTTFAAGPELKDGSGGICTACHAGENAYIVHPEDPAFAIANLAPSAWYKPFKVPAGWPLNPGPNVDLSNLAIPAGERKCTSYHDLPIIEKALATPAGENYCDAVLNTAKRSDVVVYAVSVQSRLKTEFLRDL